MPDDGHYSIYQRLIRIEGKLDDIDGRIEALWTNGLLKLDRRLTRAEQSLGDHLHNSWSTFPPWALILFGIMLALGGEGIRMILRLFGH